MIEDNKQDRSRTEGQSRIDRETEDRNRENESGQSQPTTDQDRDTPLSERTGQTGGEASTGEAGSEGFVGSGKDDSSDYLTKGEENQDFAPQGQGAQDTDAGRSDIETGQSSNRESELDEG